MTHMPLSLAGSVPGAESQSVRTLAVENSGTLPVSNLQGKEVNVALSNSTTERIGIVSSASFATVRDADEEGSSERATGRKRSREEFERLPSVAAPNGGSGGALADVDQAGGVEYAGIGTSSSDGHSIDDEVQPRVDNPLLRAPARHARLWRRIFPDNSPVDHGFVLAGDAVPAPVVGRDGQNLPVRRLSFELNRLPPPINDAVEDRDVPDGLGLARGGAAADDHSEAGSIASGASEASGTIDDENEERGQRTPPIRVFKESDFSTPTDRLGDPQLEGFDRAISPEGSIEGTP